MAMTITLYFNDILAAVKAISHSEVEAISDADARYRAEAGGEKDFLLRDCISSAKSKLKHRCLRFLDNDYTEAAGAEDVEVTYVFVFDMNAGRRANGKADILAKAMHNFIVEYALSKFYSDVSQPDLSNKHSLAAVEIGNSIDEMLYTKLPPQ